MRVTAHNVTVINQKVTANYVPAAAVIRRWQALSGFIGRKGSAGGLLSLNVKALSLTEEEHRKLKDLSAEEESGTPCVAVKCVDIWKNTSGEGGSLVCY